MTLAVQMDELAQSIQYLKGVGPERAELFERLGVRTVLDLLYLLPRQYQDLRRATPIGSLVPERLQLARARLEYVVGKPTRRGDLVVEAAFSDETGYLTVVWFNRPTVADSLRLEGEYWLTGKVDRRDGRRRMVNPKIEAVGEDSAQNTNETLTPVYPLTEGLHVDAVRRAMRAALERYADKVPELLPAGFRQSRGLPGVGAALRGAHFPRDCAEQKSCRNRLVYDEFLTLQVALALKRAGQRRRPSYTVTVNEEIDRRIRRLYPFQLTASQDRVVAEIVADLSAPAPMYRLLQGDVASGKTAVAVYAVLAVIANGHQAAVMAPTEVLARQHFHTFESYLAHSRVRRLLLTGSLSAAERSEALGRLAAGRIDLVVGTHALLQEDVTFRNLALLVIDEQHKFGVRQRAHFQKQPRVPHHLVMTATPIPRSLSMTWFGDLDLSVIEQPPPRASRDAYLRRRRQPASSGL